MSTSTDPIASIPIRSPAVMERRRSPRVASRVSIDLRCDGLPCGLAATSRDLGAGGVCVETRGPFALQSLRSLEIGLPDGTLRCSAVGIWQRENDARTGTLSGVHFNGLAKPDREQVNRFVHRCAQDLSEFLCERSELVDLTIDDALDIAFCTRMADYPSGHPVYAQNTIGVRGDSLYIVLEGSVNFEARHGASRPILLRQVGPGGIFAGTPFMSTRPHVESAVTAAKTTLLEIDPYTFRYLEQNRPGVASAVSRTLLAGRSAQIEALVRRIADA